MVLRRVVPAEETKMMQRKLACNSLKIRKNTHDVLRRRWASPRPQHSTNMCCTRVENPTGEAQKQINNNDMLVSGQLLTMSRKWAAPTVRSFAHKTYRESRFETT